MQRDTRSMMVEMSELEPLGSKLKCDDLIIAIEHLIVELEPFDVIGRRSAGRVRSTA